MISGVITMTARQQLQNGLERGKKTFQRQSTCTLTHIVLNSSEDKCSLLTNREEIHDERYDLNCPTAVS